MFANCYYEVYVSIPVKFSYDRVLNLKPNCTSIKKVKLKSNGAAEIGLQKKKKCLPWVRRETVKTFFVMKLSVFTGGESNKYILEESLDGASQ